MIVQDAAQNIEQIGGSGGQFRTVIDDQFAN